MKKFLLLMSTFVIFLCFTPTTTEAAYKPVNVVCDGHTLSNASLYAINKKGTIMIPYDILTKYPGITKVYGKYKASKKYLTIDRNNICLEMYLGKNKLIDNNEFNFKLPQKVCYYQIANAKKVMIPAQKVCNLLGFKCTYNASTNTLQLQSKQAIKNYKASMTAKPFLLMSTEEFVEAIGPIAQREYHKSGMLASVTIAQAINESWSGTSYLAQKGNNLFGMKTYLSGNNWKGSSWKRKRVVKKTKEQYGKRVVTITAAFRKYDNVGQSFKDHSAYFINAKNDSGGRRYKGLAATKSYKKQIAIIQKGGYCTFRNYGANLRNLIKKYNLTRFDK